jgi:acetyl esterase/lipase
MLSVVSPSGHYDRIEDLRYGNGERQSVDIYQPRDVVPGAPLVVYFYGGGWNDGSKEEFEFVASSLTRAGLVVAIPDYRLFPHVTCRSIRCGSEPAVLDGTFCGRADRRAHSA